MVLTYFDIHDLGDFPEVDKKADEDADLHHKVGLVVEYVEQHNQRLEHAEDNGAHGEAFQRLSAVPELDVLGVDEKP